MSAPFKHTDVTPEEFQLMKVHHRKFEYTPADQLEVFNLVRKYVNPHIQYCLSCDNSLREVKDALNAFYLRYTDEIELRLNPPVDKTSLFEKIESHINSIAETPIEIAVKETKEYTKATKKGKKK
jgi:hypothetical protein